MKHKLRIVAALLFGLLAWYAAAIVADYVLVRSGLPAGARYAILGAVELFLGGAAILLALRIADMRAADAGLRSDHLASDMAVGLGIAAAFAALQFLVIIPATGGAERSDIVANAAQVGETPGSLAGILVLALLGSTSEELLFRGLLLAGIARLDGGGTLAKAGATVVVVVLFALSHGYQGWAGIIDTGLFGGLLLSLTYWWRGMRLAAPIAAHAAWNVIAAIIIFAAY